MRCPARSEGCAVVGAVRRGLELCRRAGALDQRIPRASRVALVDDGVAAAAAAVRTRAAQLTRCPTILGRARGGHGGTRQRAADHQIIPATRRQEGENESRQVNPHTHHRLCLACSPPQRKYVPVAPVAARRCRSGAHARRLAGAAQPAVCTAAYAAGWERRNAW